MKKTFPPDVNVWVALVFDHHDHHAAALSWVKNVGDQPTDSRCMAVADLRLP
jgi:predicted nucleic acid-binding protein